ncbi:MAG: acetyl-CoA carboxylase biotin carboxyl carrier protein subunit [Bradyrhizobium sp.]|nr:acetyl-CoA carboxylase biotin carboxyl carrier protein subunit [Bradyrhizobium sp.]
MATLGAQDIETLLELFDRSDWRELRLEMPGLDLFVSKDAAPMRGERRSTSSPAMAAVPAVAAPPPEPAGSAPLRIPPGWVAIRAPSLGTFYRAAKPGSPPLVEIGQVVRPETEVCLVEVMKLFTGVQAGIAGVLREVLVSDGELVEYEQPLFLVDPSG